MTWIEWTHWLSSFWMMAVIWFVQIVHYPMFQLIPESHRIHASEKHQAWISWIVMPPMLLEAFSMLAMVSDFWHSKLFIVSAVLLMIIWASTFLLQVPCHHQLLKNPTDEVISRLVHTNWIRTVSWTVKTILIGWLFFGGLL